MRARGRVFYGWFIVAVSFLCWFSADAFGWYTFGRTFLGTIRGVTMPANLISVAGGPLFAAWLRDTTGSYQLPYTIFFVVVLVGTCVLFFTGPPRKQDIANPARGAGGFSGGAL